MQLSGYAGSNNVAYRYYSQVGWHDLKELSAWMESTTEFYSIHAKKAEGRVQDKYLETQFG
jgi:hypothetical protein